MRKLLIAALMLIVFLIGWFASKVSYKTCLEKTLETWERPTICKIIFVEV